MPRVSDAEVQQELDLVRQIVNSHRDGINRSAIAEVFRQRGKEGIQDRTLQRRLSLLVRRGEIEAHGRGSATIYKPTAVKNLQSTQKATAEEEGYPPLTTDAAELRTLINRPVAARTPVGYDRDFLFDYKPGQTWYLSAKQRAQLIELGKTPDADRPAGTFARDILARLLIDLSWASSRLEGNTYSRLDTLNLIEFGQEAEGKDARDAQMILNHKTAIEHLVSGAEYVGFNKHTLTALHAALSENLLDNPGDEGRLRETPVTIGASKYTPIAIPQVISECFDRIIDTANAIPDPFERSLFAMVHLPYLQPFVDVNKRTSRLAANIPLIEGNLCPLSFVDVPEQAYVDGTLAVYELRRVELLRDVFMFAYERSAAQYRVIRESLGTPNPIRLRYRVELAEVVQQTVLADEAPSARRLAERGRALGVREENIDDFSQAAFDIVLHLHEGSASRYRLTPSQFSNWKSLFGPVKEVESS